ncbi:MAG: hypothetical protein ISR69_14675 [Gammaproteobacteria bacterium]|nr:hypothetical protein [Gammaproteobacteria bacterium]
MMPVIYFLVSLFIGLLGINKKLGFWGYFFGSLLFTPLIGVILLCASDKRKVADPDDE